MARIVFRRLAQSAVVLWAAFTLSGPTISHHLRVLRETGLVDVERRATWAYYRIRPDVLTQLSALLAATATPDRSTSPMVTT